MKYFIASLLLSFSFSSFAEEEEIFTLDDICSRYSAHQAARCYDAIENVKLQREAIGLCVGWSEVHKAINCVEWLNGRRFSVGRIKACSGKSEVHQTLRCLGL